MIDSRAVNENRLRHFVALAVAMLVLVLIFFIPSGIVGYFMMSVISLSAVLIGHRAVRFQGKFLWAAIVGLILSYIFLIFAISLLVVRTVLTFSG